MQCLSSHHQTTVTDVDVAGLRRDNATARKVVTNRGGRCRGIAVGKGNLPDAKRYVVICSGIVGSLVDTDPIETGFVGE